VCCTVDAMQLAIIYIKLIFSIMLCKRHAPSTPLARSRLRLRNQLDNGSTIFYKYKAPYIITVAQRCLLRD